MEDASQSPYQDSPSTSRSSTPTPLSQTSHAKPLPSLPSCSSSQPPEPYRDEPSPTAPTPSSATALVGQHRSSASFSNTHQHPGVQVFFTPYTDALPSESDDDVPLAYLLPLPTEAPPPYQVAVREAYRATLIQHIPDPSLSTLPDEEMGVERAHADDVRFTVERVVAAIIVAMLLLIIAALMALVAVSGFTWKL